MLTFFRSFLWIIPFFCFMSGYILLDTFYHAQEIEMPALIGKNIESVFTTLSNLNLNARLLSFKEDAHITPGTILNQIPAQTQKIKQGQSVFLVVSSKPKKLKAPNLIGKSSKDIDLVMQENKLHSIIYQVESNYPKGQCFAQQPMPEQDVENDDMIVYIADSQPKIVLVPDLKNKPLNYVLDFLKEHNITYEVIHTADLPINHTCDNCIVLDQRPLSGSLVSLHQEKSLHMQLHVRGNI